MGEGGDEVNPVSFVVGSHGRLNKNIDGGDEEDGAEGLEKVNEVFFPCFIVASRQINQHRQPPPLVLI